MWDVSSLVLLPKSMVPGVCKEVEEVVVVWEGDGSDQSLASCFLSGGLT